MMKRKIGGIFSARVLSVIVGVLFKCRKRYLVDIYLKSRARRQRGINMGIPPAKIKPANKRQNKDA